MAAIDRPTLVIANDRDCVHPLAYARRLAALIPVRGDVITSKTVDPALYTREFAALARFPVGGRAVKTFGGRYRRHVYQVPWPSRTASSASCRRMSRPRLGAAPIRVGSLAAR